MNLLRCILKCFSCSFNLYLNSKWICHEVLPLISILFKCSTVYVVASGFLNPRYRHNWTGIWFHETKFILQTFFCQSLHCQVLFIIDICFDCLFINTKVMICCFVIQKSGIRNRAVKQSLNTRRQIPAYRGSKGMKTYIDSPWGSFQQLGGSVAGRPN